MLEEWKGEMKGGRLLMIAHREVGVWEALENGVRRFSGGSYSHAISSIQKVDLSEYRMFQSKHVLIVDWCRQRVPTNHTISELWPRVLPFRGTTLAADTSNMTIQFEEPLLEFEGHIKDGMNHMKLANSSFC